MGQGHGHGLSAAEAVSASGRYLNGLWIAAGLGAVTFVLQVTVGLSTSSLALLSDSAHVFTDVFGVSMAITAILVARRVGRGAGRTFGMYRGEVLAALGNAFLLFAVAGWVLYEAIGRLASPPEVPGWPVIIVGAIGLFNNFLAFMMLREGAKESINVRGAYLEVMADVLGSIGVLVSGAVTVLTGWRYTDTVIGVAIGLFVLPRAFGLGRRALRILFQHAPEQIDVTVLQTELGQLDGVTEVHDLHVWTLTSGMEVASAHLTTRPEADTGAVLVAAQKMLADRYHIEHATLQVEPGDAPTRCRELSW
ncbi:cation efflux system protein [Longimycelium tulufanense]|uniref:Cation efflux system protein n=1 Tax=Longimycelium tulufanense TaxID=907463 RepID=A0A8J3FTJ8_9PSEU|nr:cation diffusion facilitator family transporter [Longimycelium tulufanense]GGM34885.1 cation efflux system protein [Longimycelium tulufanense]